MSVAKELIELSTKTAVIETEIKSLNNSINEQWKNHDIQSKLRYETLKTENEIRHQAFIEYARLTKENNEKMINQIGSIANRCNAQIALHTKMKEHIENEKTMKGLFRDKKWAVIVTIISTSYAGMFGLLIWVIQTKMIK